MRSKSKKARKKITSARKIPVKSKTPVKKTANPSRDRFVKDLIVRGEAAKLTKAGKLPPNATHVIVKENDEGAVEVKRVRTKLY